MLRLAASCLVLQRERDGKQYHHFLLKRRFDKGCGSAARASKSSNDHVRVEYNAHIKYNMTSRMMFQVVDLFPG